MKTKLTHSLLVAILILGIGVFAAGSVKAQSASFPNGCGSALGYSATTGNPCNGKSTAILGFLPGCSTALGYSSTTGEPCSGGSSAIAYLAGCTSTFGYSAETGAACNGTGVATLVAPPLVLPVTPGLPTTGDGGNIINNILLLVISGGTAALGSLYIIARKSDVA